MLRRLRGKGPKKKGGDLGKLEVVVLGAGDDEYEAAESGPCQPSFPLPAAPVLAILQASKDETADYTPQQLKFVVKEWNRLELERSVCFSVYSIEEAVSNANSLWGQMPTALEDGSARPRKQTFAVEVKRTRGEILDEMYQNPVGVLCKATEALSPKTPGGFSFRPGDLVLCLRTIGAGSMFDGIAHGLRGEFSTALVERDPNQPSDMSFMWLNQKRTALVDVKPPATFDYGGQDDDYLDINEENDEDDDDGTAGDGSDTAADAWATPDPEVYYLGGGSGGGGVDIEQMLFGEGSASSSEEGAEADETADEDDLADTPKAAEAGVDDLSPVDPASRRRPGLTLDLSGVGGASPELELEAGDGDVPVSPGASSGASAVSSDTGEVEQFSSKTANANEGPWGKAIMSPPPMRRAGSMPDKVKPKQKDGESGSKMGWLGRPTRRSKRSATLTGSYTMSQSMPTNPNSEIVKAAASAQMATMGDNGKPSKASRARSRDLQTMGMQTNFWRRSFLLRSSSKEAANSKFENPYTERAFMFIKNCIEAMHELGVDEAGIYRIAGVKSKITRLHDSFCIDMKMVEFDTYDIPTLSSAVKYFFREVKMPLLTPYASWLYAVTSTAPGSQERTAELTRCLQSLPWPNQAILTLLMNHLQIVEKLSDANKMTASNIGVVFGPTLLRPVDDRDQVDVLADIPHCAQVVASLISLVSPIDDDTDADDDDLVSEPGDGHRGSELSAALSPKMAGSPSSGVGSTVGNATFDEDATEEEEEDPATGLSRFVPGRQRGSFSSFGSGFGDYNTEEEEEEDAGVKQALDIEAGEPSSSNSQAARSRSSGRRGIGRNRPTSVYGFDGMLSPEFLSPGSQAPAKIEEDEEIALPSLAGTAPPVTSLPPIEPDDESDDESNSDDDYADDAEKGYIKISFPVKQGGSAAAQNEDAAEPVARPGAPGFVARTGALGRSQRAASVYGGFGPAEEEEESDTDGELPDDPDSDESFGC